MTAPLTHAEPGDLLRWNTSIPAELKQELREMKQSFARFYGEGPYVVERLVDLRVSEAGARLAVPSAVVLKTHLGETLCHPRRDLLNKSLWSKGTQTAVLHLCWFESAA